jgi:hypothetical protein
MRRKIIVLLISCFCVPAVPFAQDTVKLVVKAPRYSVILQKYHADTARDVIAPGGELKTDTIWFLKIVDPANSVHVRLSNNEVDSTTIILRDFSGAYMVKRDALFVNDTARFSFGKSVRIEIIPNDASVKATIYNIGYTTSTITPTGSQSDGATAFENYKVGSPVFDAWYLVKDTGVVIKKKILAFYDNNRPGLDSDYRANKLMRPLADNILKQSSARNSLGLSALSMSSLGGLDVTSIADGLAKFLVKRTKKELNIAFFEKFKKLISSDGYKDLQTLFPQTYRGLSTIGEEIYNYEAYISTLRESFENDLRTLDKNLPSIIKNHEVFFTAHPELAATLQTGCYVAGALEDKVHPGDILKDYPDEYLSSLHPNWKNAVRTLQLFSVSLRDTGTKADSAYWISAKELKKMLADTLVFRTYLGLICQQVIAGGSDSIYFTNKNGERTSLVKMFNLLADEYKQGLKKYAAYTDFIRRFSEKTDKISRMLKNYQKPANDSLAIQQYYDYFQESIGLLEHCAEISKLPTLKDIIPNLTDTLKNYFDVAHSTADMILSIRKRNYASAIVQATHIYSIVMKGNRELVRGIDKKADKLIDDINTAQAAIEAAKQNSAYTSVSQLNNAVDKLNIAIRNATDSVRKKDIAALQTGIQQANDAIKKLRDSLPLIAHLEKEITVQNDALQNYKDKLGDAMVTAEQRSSKLFKYGSFMAAMVQAKSGDEVEAAIESIALPTGSARIKRESPFNVAVNAYMGLYTGYEKISGFDDNCWQFNSFGVTAPVGISVSRGHSFLFFGTGEDGWKRGKKGWSTSLFVSVIDIGSVAAFRFKNDKAMAAQSPGIQLKNIFSPGLFLSLGIPKCPLSINMGAQMGANLRKVSVLNNATKLDFSDNTYWRYSISICVDLPLLNLYTKSR